MSEDGCDDAGLLVLVLLLFEAVLDAMSGAPSRC